LLSPTALPVVVVATAIVAEEGLSSLLELLVDLVDELGSGGEVAKTSEQYRHSGDGHRGRERDPQAEAHGSRSTYPTP
jgi:hypothetical protein